MGRRVGLDCFLWLVDIPRPSRERTPRTPNHKISLVVVRDSRRRGFNCSRILYPTTNKFWIKLISDLKTKVSVLFWSTKVGILLILKCFTYASVLRLRFVYDLLWREVKDVKSSVISQCRGVVKSIDNGISSSPHITLKTIGAQEFLDPKRGVQGPLFIVSRTSKVVWSRP